MSKVKKITVTQCTGCPNRDHKGAFGQVSYVPVCRKLGKVIPYTVTEQKTGLSTLLIASQKVDIPSWCPLEDND